MRRAIAIAALIACGCTGDLAPGIAIDADVDADVVSDAGVEAYACRGIMGLRCPSGFVCVDYEDGCRPELGDMDCIGECIDAREVQ